MKFDPYFKTAVDDVVGLYKTEMPIQDIANTLGVTPMTIYRRLKTIKPTLPARRVKPLNFQS